MNKLILTNKWVQESLDKECIIELEYDANKDIKCKNAKKIAKTMFLFFRGKTHYKIFNELQKLFLEQRINDFKSMKKDINSALKSFEEDLGVKNYEKC
jgi:predicted membrane chloride channel (bestrophin family)